MAELPFLPYGRQWIDDDDVAAVVAALRSELIAHGPRVAAFEQAFAAVTGAAEAVACSSGTAALHLALAALDIGPGDICIVPAITFLATASAVLYRGAQVRFADVDPDTGLMTPETLTSALDAAPNARAVLPVHLGGRFCDMPAIASIARARGCRIVEDACHAVGGVDAQARPAGACAHSDAATFSFHPVKTLAAGEGGMVTCNDAERSERMRRLRNHGVTRDPGRMTAGFAFDAGAPNPWAYEQLELGFNYRMNELEAALGLSQLGKLTRFAERRRALAARYDDALKASTPLLRPVRTPLGQSPVLHLYTVLVDFEAAGVSRAALMRSLAERGIGSQVHYIPLPWQPVFQPYAEGRRFPGAEAYYARVLALPLYPAMADADVDRVATALRDQLRPR